MPSPLTARLPEMVGNIRAVYARATATEREDGRSWYPRAHAIMCEWSETYGYSIATVACVTAALSPQVEWTRNVIMADDILAGRPPSIGGYLRTNRDKAERVRDERLSNLTTVFKGGPKVNNFAANLAGDYYNAVTIDAHAAQIALDEPTYNAGLSWAKYAVFATAYFQAARELGMAPAELQATVWLTWKRMYPPVTKRRVIAQHGRQWKRRT